MCGAKKARKTAGLLPILEIDHVYFSPLESDDLVGLVGRIFSKLVFMTG